MPIVNNLNEISDVYLGSEKITDVYAGNDKVKSGQQELPWTQPVLSANGTIGGNSFACAASSILSGYEAYKAFDNSTSTYWNPASYAPQWLEWYNPNPLKITQLNFITDSNFYIDTYTIQASEDNINWRNVYSKSGNTSANFTININDDNRYSYWRINITGGGLWNTPSVSNLTITATQIV